MRKVLSLLLAVTFFTVIPASAQGWAAKAPCGDMAAASECCGAVLPSVECPVTDCASSGAPALVACSRDVQALPISAGHDTVLDRYIVALARAPDTAPPKSVV